MSTSTPTWFITGASSGFGLAFARYALSKGYNVVATARTTEKLQSLQAEGGDRLLTVELDVNRAGAADEAIATAIATFGGIDVLINNAGYAIVGALEETPEAEIRALMDTNFFGAMAVTRAALPHMRKRGKGAIVNISSMGGQMSFAGVGAYSATKFALEGFSEALAQEVAPFGIKVLVVEPGAFRTSLVSNAERFMPSHDAYRETLAGVRKAMLDMDGTQAGDPLKAAAAIDLALASENTPLRLQLGDDAIDAVRQHAERLLADLEIWKDVGSNTRLDV
ncbi:oxidoreductase [Rhizobium jaguaris]|uniref:SDR family NAD(P)-dependent oxidoreductase n=1 Tax=Rhizobium jaguaris TaxID=1312183 RepID=A0A387FRH3_9HYPH|nr:oxidoreductase [Rhizobium jaguaris]AYG61033.1 SDR family NAD(P)-dependent oxidoreductase [Rhizobium jaguaris]